MRKWFAILLASVPLLAEDRTANIELCLFSGRKRPQAIVTDSGQIAALQTALSARLSLPVPCAEVPPQPSTPAYTGLLLAFTPAYPAPSSWFMVRNGFIHSETNQPCYRDSGQNLERLAAETAFRLEDENAPGGAKPMDYLACMVPDSLHPGAAPCATALRARGLPGKPASGGYDPVDAAGRRVDHAGRNRRGPPSAIRFFTAPRRAE
jgi:hypothetical protein